MRVPLSSAGLIWRGGGGEEGVKGEEKRKKKWWEMGEEATWMVAEWDVKKRTALKRCAQLEKKIGQEQLQRGVETKRKRQTETEGQWDKGRDRIRE